MIIIVIVFTFIESLITTEKETPWRVLHWHMLLQV